jgi:acyl-CoA synthetase (AMP-forming)/AMP-acid ligase II
MTETLSALIAGHDGAAPALGAPGRAWMDYGALRRLSGTVAAALHGAGVGRGDRVAIVLPNGPEMAAAFVTVAQVATTCPLNPAYKEDEFAFYLEDLKAKAIILMEGEEGPAFAAAERLGLAVVRLVPDADGAAGAFSLRADASAGTADSAAPGPEDVALILHTSGTTSRPKIVPLLQSNLAASARNIGASLDLTSAGPVPERDAAVPHPRADRGGVGLAGGGRLGLVRAGLRRAEVLRLDEGGAAQLVHRRADDASGDPGARGPQRRDHRRGALRFLRSSSASLPGPVMEKLAETFGAPVIEGYGMTEATHQMASNPLPPRAQKPGSVGVEAGRSCASPMRPRTG